MIINYYKILDISEDASDQEIKNAYKKLVKIKHPDKLKNTKKADEEFINIKKAYETLSNPHNKYIYDMQLKNKNNYTDLNHSMHNYQSNNINILYKKTYNFGLTEIIALCLIINRIGSGLIQFIALFIIINYIYKRIIFHMK